MAAFAATEEKAEGDRQVVAAARAGWLTIVRIAGAVARPARNRRRRDVEPAAAKLPPGVFGRTCLGSVSMGSASVVVS